VLVAKHVGATLRQGQRVAGVAGALADDVADGQWQMLQRMVRD